MKWAVFAQGIPIPGNELIAVFDADQVARREVRHSAMMQLALTASLLAAGIFLHLEMDLGALHKTTHVFLYDVVRLSCKATCPLRAETARRSTVFTWAAQL